MKILTGYDTLWRYDYGMWSWLSGSSDTNQPAVHGLLGEPGTENTPGARSNSVMWIDSNDTLWLFGGLQTDNLPLNDLWRYRNDMWTWMGGSSMPNDTGHYGPQGDPANIPSARAGAAYCYAKNTLWLFGGRSISVSQTFNDLWKFDGQYWTWVHGPQEVNQPPISGDKGIADVNNLPPSSFGASAWCFPNGSIFLFGGGSDKNTLWQFDGQAWAWIFSLNHANYGSLGISSSNNQPPSRIGAYPWTENDGSLWMFGGRSASPECNFSLSSLTNQTLLNTMTCGDSMDNSGHGWGEDRP